MSLIAKKIAVLLLGLTLAISGCASTAGKYDADAQSGSAQQVEEEDEGGSVVTGAFISVFKYVALIAISLAVSKAINDAATEAVDNAVDDAINNR